MRRRPAGAYQAQSIIQVAPPTGNAALDNAAIKAAIGLCPTGGIVQLQVGTYAIIDGTTTSSIAVNKKLTLRGCGPSDALFANHSTLLTVEHATAVGISVSVHGVHIENLAVRNIHSPAPTAGAGIQVVSGGGNSMHYGPDLAVMGFYDCIDHQAGGEWCMEPSCFVYDFVRSGLRIQNVDNTDSGDAFVSGEFVAGPNNNGIAGILWLSGGGTKIVGAKFNTRSGKTLTACIDMELQDGVATSDMLITGCSLENAQYGLLVEHAGPSNTGVFNNILVTGCQFLHTVAAAQSIAVAPAATSKVARVNISGCVFRNSGSGTSYGINFVKIDNASHGPNIFSGFSSDYHDGGSNTNITSVGNG